MPRPSIFRQAALERLSSPEQLDRLMHVTNPKGWVALIGLWVVLIFVLFWSVFGRLPTTIAGSGIILSSEGIREVEVLASGVVTELRVRVGDAVSPGDTVARVGQPILRQQVQQAEDRLELLREERGRREDFTSSNASLETEVLDAEREDLTRRQASISDRIHWLEGRVEAEEEALTLGLVTPEAVQNTIQQLEAARAELNGVEMKLQNNDLARLLLSNRSSESIEDVDQRIRTAERDLQALRLQLEQSSIVLSPYAGYIREIRSDVGQLVVSGQSLVSVEMVDSPLQAVVFVPTEGKRIQPGMEAHVSPVTVKREEYGYLLGTVSFVSPQPATREGMMRTLGNEILVEQLAGMGAPFLVEVDLLTDPDTPSGFQWSSGSGPPGTVDSGTMVGIEVVVEEQRPISLVIPAFRSLLGTS